MNRFLLCFVIFLCASPISLAQQNPADAPASKEDVERYMAVMHSREMVSKTLDAMMKPMHQMLHEQYEKDKDKLPSDFEARMNKVMDDCIKEFPWDEMLAATVPVYQKHFTKGDIDNLVAFYSAPTGQKILREMPTILEESMQAMMPLMRKSMEAMTQRVQDMVAEMLKESNSGPGKNPPLTKD
jgi:hypothetical protein